MRGSRAAGRLWHVSAVVILSAAALVNMRGWLLHDLIPPPRSDLPGYAAVAQEVRDALLRYGRVPAWSAKWFAGSTVFLSSLKECLAFPFTVAMGPVRGIEVTIVLAKVAAALGVWAIFARFLRAPVAGLIAAYAYAFGEVGNRLAWRLDGAISYALFPAILIAFVDTVRRRRARDALVLGVLLACQFDDNYLHVLLCAPMFVLLLALRPWESAGAAGTPTGRALPALAGVTAAVFLGLAGSQLAWIALDAKHHGFFSEAGTRTQMEYLSEFEPFLLVNRADWMARWLSAHAPADVGIHWERAGRYLGGVVIGCCALGWLAARSDRGLRRWYQLGVGLFGIEYWLAMGPWTLLRSLARSFHHDDAFIAAAYRWCTGGAFLCWGVALACALRGHTGAWRRRAVLALGVGVLLFGFSNSGFEILRAAVPLLARVRSPGKFFDLAPLPLALAFGVSLVGLGARLRARPALARGVALAVATAMVVDFWPSTARFSVGLPPEVLRREQHLIERLPAEDGTLRILMVSSDTWPWVANWAPWDSLLTMQSDVGGATSWLLWQADTHWAPYLAALGASLDACRRGDADACHAPFLAIARVAHVVRWRPARSLFAPQAPTARAGDVARYDVLPMAHGYRAWAVLTAAPDAAVLSALPGAFDRHLALVSVDAAAEEPRSDVAAGAALVWEGSDTTADSRWSSRIAAVPAQPLIDVAYRSPDPEHIVLEADAGSEPALLFVSASYHPWWHAAVDGEPAPVLRAQAAFMAVRVPPGHHVITLRLQRPAVVATADTVTEASWVALSLGIAVAGLLRLRRGRSADLAGGEAH